MTNPKTIKQLCDESPEFKEKITDIVLQGPFDSFDSDEGRPHKATTDKKWLFDIRQKFICGKL